jgi:hypothetical protein
MIFSMLFNIKTTLIYELPYIKMGYDLKMQ